MKIQKDAANAMNAQLLAEKQRLENALAVRLYLPRKTSLMIYTDKIKSLFNV